MKIKLLYIVVALFVFCGSWGQATLPVARTVWNSTPTGWIVTPLDSYTTTFACSGSNGAKFDTTGDIKIVNFDSSPDKLSFVVKSNTTTTSVLLVEESDTGSTYTTVVSLAGATDLPTTCTTKGDYQLKTTTRFVRWTFTRGTSNMTMDDVSITKFDINAKTYQLINAPSDLVAGSKYLVVSRNTSGVGAALGYQNTNNRGKSDITVSNVSGVITIATVPATLNTETTKVFEVTLGGSSGAWTLYDAVNSGYLYAANTGSGTNNYLNVRTTPIDNWTVTFSSGAAVITDYSNTTTRNIIRFNSLNVPQLFSCYAGTQDAVYLYKEVPSGYTVIFNSNGGTGTMTNQTASTATNLSSNTFTRTGYTFSGWNTAADASGTAYANNASYPFAANTTLYAQWSPDYSITFANLQFPGSGSIPEGGTFEFFGEVYAAGLTEAAGQGAGITAEFGYSTSNTNPDTWTNWQAATFNMQKGNNDEYKFTLSGLAIGTYYYATRFRYGSEPWIYGGYNTNLPTAGGNWNGVANYSGVLTVNSNVVDFANLELPYTGTITEGADFDAFAKVYKNGYTEPAGASASINAWIGISTTNATTTADFNSGWTWIPATWDSQPLASNDDIYKANIAGASRPAGTYYYVSRFSVTGSTEFRYGGINNAFWSASTHSGVLTITKPTITITPTSLTGFTYIYGSGPSTVQSFTVSGTNLTANISLNTPTNYEISTTATSGFTTSINLTQTAGSVASTTIYVRLKAGLTVANYNETITATSTSAANKTVTLTGNVTQKTLTVVSAVAQNKPYDGTTTATITGATLVGIISPDVVTVSATGTFASANVGTGIAVTSTATLGGADAGNYSLTQPTGLSANITAILPTIATTTISITTGGTYALQGANVSSNSGGAFSYVLGTATPVGSVTLTGTTLNGIAVGTATLTVNQAANGNYTAGSTTVSVSVTNCTPPIWEENFDYGSCDNANLPNLTSNWVRFSGSANDAKYNSSSLTYSSYPSSGIGGSFSFENGGSDDIRREFSSAGISSGSVYASFLININTAGSGEDFFVTLLGDPSNTSQNARVFTVPSGSGYKLGVGKLVTTAGTNTSSLLNFNQTYLVVIKYEFISGGVNDPFKLWVISSGVPISEASAGTFITATLSGTDATNLKSFAIKQTNKPKGSLDGIRVATSWESLFCGTTPTATNYTWTGAISNSWSNAGNWLPNGVPSSIDNIIISSAGTNVLNITDCRTVKDFNLNGTGSFTASATGVFTITGTIAYGGTASATLDCDSQVNITSSASQLIPPLTYGNLDALGGNRTFSPTGTIKICSAFSVNPSTYSYTVDGSTVEYISSASWIMSSFTYNNLTFSGNGSFSIGSSSPAANKTITVLGNYLQSAGNVSLGDTSSMTATLNIDGDLTISGGNINLNQTSGGTGIINLKGDLSVSNSSSQFTSSTVGGKINFVGTGDGTTEALTQSIDIKNTNSIYYTALSVNSGYTKLANQDLYLGTNSTFEVKNGATLDFGYASNNITSLNIVRVSSPTLRAGQTFTTQTGSTLKITSPTGISNGTSVYTGNVQIGADATKRIFSPDATYHYVGKENQVSGNGLPNAITGKVLVELDTDVLTFNASGNKTFNTAGTLEIKKGIVIDDSSNSFGDATSNNGKLTMSGGRYRIFKGSTQPDLSGTYNLTAGVVEYAGTLAKTVRSPKSYQNIEVPGDNVGNSSGNITLNDNGTFIVKTGGIFSINANSIVGATGTQSVTVENGAIFKTGDPDGFSGSNQTSIQPTIDNIILATGSTVEYSRSGNQTITNAAITFPSDANYQNLTISGTGEKTLVLGSTDTKINEDLKVDASKFLVNVDEVITVNKAIKIDGGTFEIENNGQLIQIDEVDSNENTSIETDNFKVNRITQVKNYDYVYWSSPVDGFAVSNLPNNNRYFWDPVDTNANSTQGNWLPAFGIMNKGQGYIARISNSSPTVAVATTLVFEGTKPFNGEFSYQISRGTVLGTSDDCWNLVGNPYPSAIDAELFLVENQNIEGSVRVWKHGASPVSGIDSPFYQNFIYNYNEDDYLIYNATATSEPNTFNGKIASGQGFFIRMLDEEDGEAESTVVVNSTITFKNAFRRATNGDIFDNSNFYKSRNAKQDIEKSRIWLDLISSNKQITKTVVGYVPGATLAKDRLYDALIEVESFKLYSLINTQKQAIQGRPLPFDSNDLVPMGMFIEKEGSYIIAISAVDGLFSDASQSIYLEDKLLNIIHDLKRTPYTFTSTAGEFNERFVLRYNNSNALSKADFELANQIVITTKESQLTITSKAEAISKIQIFDMLGRRIYDKKNVNANIYSIADLVKNQVLIVKVKLQNGEEMSNKVIVK